jgi:GNAT superfamily N-acetyltransferase
MSGVMKLTLARVGWNDPRAEELRDGMELEMNELYGSSLDQLDPTVVKALLAGFDVDPTTIVATVLASVDARIEGVAHGEQIPVGQAGLRPHVGTAGQPALEVKKVIVDPAYRGRGISRALMLELEVAARELGIDELILQTGDLQPAAIGLYVSLGYVLIPSYPPYDRMPGALCYAKAL